MMPKEGSWENMMRRKEECKRMISLRTAWRTTPVGKRSVNWQINKDLASYYNYQVLTLHKN